MDAGCHLGETLQVVKQEDIGRACGVWTCGGAGRWKKILYPGFRIFGPSCPDHHPDRCHQGGATMPRDSSTTGTGTVFTGNK